jgi:hypothetical protein
VNKFEALKQFQGWPHDSQLLCVEFFHAVTKDRGALAMPTYDEPFPFDQPKAAKVASTRTGYSRKELDYIDSLIHAGSAPSVFANSFFNLFPESGHSFDSLKTKFHKRRKELLKRGEL